MNAGDEMAERLKINRDALDQELIEQPQLFWQVSERYLWAVSIRDARKEELEQTRARISLDIRSVSAKAGEKTTEAGILALVQTDSRALEVKEAYTKAVEEAARWAALKEAFSQRAYILRDLASLYVAGYFGEISVRSGGASDARTLLYEQRKREMAAKRRPSR